MQQQGPQDEYVTRARRAWHVLIERNVRDLRVRHDAVEVASRNDAEGSGVGVGWVEVKAQRDQPSQRFRIQLGIRDAVSDSMLPRRRGGDSHDAVLVTRHRPVRACVLVKEYRVERNSPNPQHSGGERVDSASFEQTS